MQLRTVNATRYVTPLKEGGSLPAIIEADDDGLYVLKFRGAGQGPKALIAELISGEIARACGLPVPEIVFVNLDPELARTEPDPEIHDLIKMSAGLNIALDYLPGSVMFNPILQKIGADLASEIVWLDAFVTNIDREPRNTNMLIWHKKLYLIDHGAALYFHHAWNKPLDRAGDAFPMIKSHCLLPAAFAIEQADKKMKTLLTRDLITNIIQWIPEEWLIGPFQTATPEEMRSTYISYLVTRLEKSHFFVKEALRARSVLV